MFRYDVDPAFCNEVHWFLGSLYIFCIHDISLYNYLPIVCENYGRTRSKMCTMSCWFISVLFTQVSVVIILSLSQTRLFVTEMRPSWSGWIRLYQIMDRCAFCIKSYPIPKIQHAVYISLDISSTAFLRRVKLLIVEDNRQMWYSSLCVIEIFPFNHFEADVESMATIEYRALSSDLMYFLSRSVCITFELQDKDDFLLLCDPDHDLH